MHGKFLRDKVLIRLGTVLNVYNHRKKKSKSTDRQKEYDFQRANEPRLILRYVTGMHGYMFRYVLYLLMLAFLAESRFGQADTLDHLSRFMDETGALICSARIEMGGHGNS